MSYSISEAAEKSGISAKMIRYYEKSGLLPPARRTPSGYRTYSDKSIDTLRFVRRARDLGFSVKDVEELLTLWSDQNRASADVKKLAQAHVDALARKKEEIEGMMSTLQHLIENCHGDDRPDCPIIDSLGSST